MKCPACGNVLQGMTVEDVSVDVCEGGCGGVWLDYGELGKIRHLPGSPEEREKAAQEYFRRFWASVLWVRRDSVLPLRHAGSRGSFAS